MQHDSAVQVSAQWDFKWLVQFLADRMVSSLGRVSAPVIQISIDTCTRWGPSPTRAGYFSHLNVFVWAKICHLPYEDRSDRCSASLDVSTGRLLFNMKTNSSFASTNLSKSSWVCCQRLLWTYRTWADHSICPNFSVLVIFLLGRYVAY